MRADTQLRRPYALAVSSLAIILVAALMADAAGASTPPGAAAPTPLARSVWHVQKTPNPQVKDEEFEGTSCVSESFCVAVGYRLNEENEFVTLAELWNGTHWKTMSTPDPEGSGQPSLESVSCASAADCAATSKVSLARQPVNASRSERASTRAVSKLECQILGTARHGPG
jgi:hypothetical protein